MERPDLIKAERHKAPIGFKKAFIIGLAAGIISVGLLRLTSYAAMPEAREVEPISVTAEKAVNPYKDIITNMTDEETDLLLAVTWYEANNQCIEGQRAVIEVIFNRVLSEDPYWPDTVKGVLSQSGQFSTWHSAKNNPHHYGQDQLDALQLVLEEVPLLPDLNYLYFSRGKFKWCTRNIRIEDHIFGGV